MDIPRTTIKGCLQQVLYTEYIRLSESPLGYSFLNRVLLLNGYSPFSTNSSLLKRGHNRLYLINRGFLDILPKSDAEKDPCSLFSTFPDKNRQAFQRKDSWNKKRRLAWTQGRLALSEEDSGSRGTAYLTSFSLLFI